MRVSTAYLFDQNLTAMLNQQTALGKTQLQVSTGKEIINPSDDPSASVQILNLQREFSLTEQYLVNADKAENRQTIEEGTLQSATSMLQRIKELAVQGLNDTNTQADRQAIAVEINQLNEQLLALANTRDSNGDYLFSGFNSSTQPYQTINGSYQGDEGQRSMQVGAGVRIETNDPGNAIFEAPLIETSVSTTGTGTGTLQIISDTGVGDIFANTLSTTGSHFSTTAMTVSDYSGANNASFDVDGIAVSLTTNYGSIAGTVTEIQNQLDASSPGTYSVSTDASDRLVIAGAGRSSTTVISSPATTATATAAPMTLANMNFATSGVAGHFELSDDTVTNMIIALDGNDYSAGGDAAGVQMAADITATLNLAGSNTVASWQVDVTGVSGHLVFTSGEAGASATVPTLNNVGADLTTAGLTAVTTEAYQQELEITPDSGGVELF